MSAAMSANEVPPAAAAKTENAGSSQQENARELAAAEHERRLAISRMQSERLLSWSSSEAALVRRNRVKVLTKWRRYLRELKEEELTAQIGQISSANDRELDHQVFKLRELNNDVDALNGSLVVLERSHFRRMGQLSDIERERLMELQSEFVRDLFILKKEFNAEKEYILRSLSASRSASSWVMASISEREVAAEHEAKSREETLCEELRNKNLEELNVVKISLESEIEEYEKQFDETHDRYIESTEDKNRQFGELKVKDTALSLDIEAIMKRIQVLLQQLAFWRKRMAQNDRECSSRNEALRSNKSGLRAQYRSLKLKMGRFRKTQNDRLQNVVAAARSTKDHNRELLECGKRILSLHAMAAAKCTERERLRPFHRHQQPGGGHIGTHSHSQCDAAKEYDDAVHGDIDIDGGHHGHPELAHFVQKYNAVLLDTTCFQQKRKSLTADNKKLRAVLKAYLDGITVSNHTVNEPNTLFVINHSTKLHRDSVATDHAQRRLQNQCVVEGNQVVNAYQRQLH